MRQLVALLALLLAVPPADAQIGGLLNRAKKAAQDAVQREAPERPAAPQTTQAPAPQQAAAVTPPVTTDDAPMSPTGPMPTSAAGYAPGIDMLNWMQKLARMRPAATAGATQIVPRAFSETPIIFPVPEVAYQVVISTASGDPVTWQDLDVQIDRYLPAFGVLTLRNSPENRNRPVFDAEAGAYRAAITANGHEIGGVDFEVTVTGSDDPFDSRSTITMSGPWQTLGALTYDADDDGSAAQDALRFHYWLSPSLASADGARLTAAIYRGTTRLNEKRGAEAIVRQSMPWWDAEDAQFYKDRGALVLGDLSDGEYRIEVAEEGRDPVHVFRFRMEGGQPVAHTRSTLDYTPRADFLTPRRGKLGRNSIDMAGMENLVWLEADQ
ncbi:MAG: hypothetical protein AAF170_05770 [Bacteroidota bacterium]